jgi:hypothetical protein
MRKSRKYLHLSVLKDALKTLAENIVFTKTTAIKDLQKKLNATPRIDVETRGIITKILKDVLIEYKKHSQQYRHMHIAYCELHGMPREKVEKRMYATPVDETEIKRIKDIYTQK